MKTHQTFVKLCFCAFQSVNGCRFSLRNTRMWRSLAAKSPCYKRSMREPCSVLQGEQEGTEGTREEKPEQSCERNSAIFVLICFFLKCEGVVMLEINGKTGGGEGKQVVHSMCCHRLPQHTCSEKPSWAFLRGSWLLQHPSVVAHRAIKVCLNYSRDPSCAISQSAEVCPEAQSLSSLVAAASVRSV